MPKGLLRFLLFIVAFAWALGLGALWLEPANWPDEIKLPLGFTIGVVAYIGWRLSFRERK